MRHFLNSLLRAALLFKGSVHMAPSGIKQPTEWVRGKSPAILIYCLHHRKVGGIVPEPSAGTVNPESMGCTLLGQAVEQPSQVSYPHWSLCGASTRSPLTQQQALPGVPILPEPGDTSPDIKVL